MLYAYDGHLYVCFKPTEANVTKLQMEALAADLNAWFITNYLVSNNDKLITTLINRPCHKPIIVPLPIVGDLQVPLSVSTCALGVVVKQINSIIKSYFFQLHSIRECVTKESTKTMVHALVTNKLDYCNSLRYGILYAKPFLRDFKLLHLNQLI